MSIWIVDFKAASNPKSTLECGLNKERINADIEETPKDLRHLLMEMLATFNETEEAYSNTIKNENAETLQTMPIGDFVWFKSLDDNYFLGKVIEVYNKERGVAKFDWCEIKKDLDYDVVKFLNNTVKFQNKIYSIPLENHELINLTHDTYNKKSKNKVKYGFMWPCDEDKK